MLLQSHLLPAKSENSVWVSVAGGVLPTLSKNKISHMHTHNESSSACSANTDAFINSQLTDLLVCSQSSRSCCLEMFLWKRPLPDPPPLSRSLLYSNSICGADSTNCSNQLQSRIKLFWTQWLIKQIKLISGTLSIPQILKTSTQTNTRLLGEQRIMCANPSFPATELQPNKLVFCLIKQKLHCKPCAWKWNKVQAQLIMKCSVRDKAERK